MAGVIIVMLFGCRVRGEKSGIFIILFMRLCKKHVLPYLVRFRTTHFLCGVALKKYKPAFQELAK